MKFFALRWWLWSKKTLVFSSFWFLRKGRWSSIPFSFTFLNLSFDSITFIAESNVFLRCYDIFFIKDEFFLAYTLILNLKTKINKSEKMKKKNSLQIHWYQETLKSNQIKYARLSLSIWMWKDSVAMTTWTKFQEFYCWKGGSNEFIL